MVGTDHHRFDRLVGWVDDWFARTPRPGVDCIVQYGTGTPPKTARGQAFFERDELGELLARAAVVICHGGPSTIIETRRRGLVPVVLPRRFALDEHVDDHQYRFARVMADRRLIHLAESAASMAEFVETGLLRPETLHVDPSAEPDPSLAAARLGSLVDSLITRRTRRTSRPAA